MCDIIAVLLMIMVLMSVPCPYHSIQAVDNNAAFPRSSNISVTIRVMDVNDNTPVFDNDPVFLRTVRENTAVDHVVHTFVATDRDSGPNGTVRYSIVSEDASGPSPSLGNYFKIGPQSGKLRLAKPIDYEQVGRTRAAGGSCSLLARGSCCSLACWGEGGTKRLFSIFTFRCYKDTFPF